MADRYDPRVIEPKWQKYWDDRSCFKIERDSQKSKYYCLNMFPYPSGDLHMGHMRNYIIGDVLARFHMMQGEAVMHPMGWDAFGLPAENAAIQRHIHPADWTRKCTETMHKQFSQLGISYNWDRGAYGTVDMTTLLAHSLNVGAATIATWMGPTTFYDYFQRFGFGRPTGIDLFAEEPGLMPLPGSGEWQESFIATNAYGQALAVTPLQMTSAISALANNGYLMQPYVVAEIRDENGTRRHEPTVVSQVIKPETAAIMTTMAVTAVQQEVQEALVEGYTVAGKTGTAQIAEPFGYHPTDVIGSFIGWLPADDPQIIVFVKLDRPTSAPWGSMTAAPVFAKLVKELVVMLDIPPDSIRLQANAVAAGGG